MFVCLVLLTEDRLLISLLMFVTDQWRHQKCLNLFEKVLIFWIKLELMMKAAQSLLTVTHVEYWSGSDMESTHKVLQPQPLFQTQSRLNRVWASWTEMGVKHVWQPTQGWKQIVHIKTRIRSEQVFLSVIVSLGTFKLNSCSSEICWQLQGEDTNAAMKSDTLYVTGTERANKSG